jgi:hypothetical protein
MSDDERTQIPPEENGPEDGAPQPKTEDGNAPINVKVSNSETKGRVVVEYGFLVLIGLSVFRRGSLLQD